tara:strand:- start:265 stop:501 length:237 start_codon:yes stop_codon:yes gene_type:complete
MEPSILHGAIIAIDTSIKNIIDGKFYVFNQEGTLRIKELRNSINQVQIRSKNPSYTDEFSNYEDLTIIGQVKWISNFL